MSIYLPKNLPPEPKAPMMVLKPDLINAIFPSFAKNLFWSIILVAILYGVNMLLKLFGIVVISSAFAIPTLLIFAVVLSFVPLIFQIFILANTKYSFYDNHVNSEFKFILIRKRSATYPHIINMTVDISIWDRLCNAGDIIVHTAEENDPDIALRFIKNPEDIETQIYALINNAKVAHNYQHHTHIHHK